MDINQFRNWPLLATAIPVASATLCAALIVVLRPLPRPLCFGTAQRSLITYGAHAAGRRHCNNGCDSHRRPARGALDHAHVCSASSCPLRPSFSLSSERSTTCGRCPLCRACCCRSSLSHRSSSCCRSRCLVPSFRSGLSATVTARHAVVCQSRQFHGRARLDDSGRNAAGHRDAGRVRAGRLTPLGVLPVVLALAGALIGFAPFNRPVARLFLGDVGSLPLGLLIAWSLVLLAGQGHLLRPCCCRSTIWPMRPSPCCCDCPGARRYGKRTGRISISARPITGSP